MIRKACALLFAMLACLSVGWGIWDINQPAGRGEVSAILHGLGLLIGLILGAVFATLAAWLAFWHVQWARRLGTVVVVGGSLFLGISVVSLFGADWKRSWDRMWAVRAGYAHMQDVSEATIEALVNDAPDYPEALALGEGLRAAGYSSYAGLMFKDPDYLRARAVWALYLAVFLDRNDPLRDPVEVTDEDCGAFATLFAARFDPAQHQARYADHCAP